MGMKAPGPKFIKKKPATWKCAACSQTFSIASYQGQSGEEKLAQLDADYEKHFNDAHAKEDASPET